jgi:hypothetical protein
MTMTITQKVLLEVRRIKVYLKDMGITHRVEIDSDNLAEIAIICDLTDSDIKDTLDLLLDDTPFLEPDYEV